MTAHASTVVPAPPDPKPARSFSLRSAPASEFDTVDERVRIRGHRAVRPRHRHRALRDDSPEGFLSDEGRGRSVAVMGRVASRPANIRRTAWLMPRMAKAVPFLGYIVAAATKPA